MIKLAYFFLYHLRNLYYKVLEKEKLSHIEAPPSARIHNEAEIFNFQSPSKIKIGALCHIRGELCVYPYGNGIKIGECSYLGKNSIVRAANSITIGNNVLIAHNVTIIDNDSHEITPKERAESYKRMLLEGMPREAGSVLSDPIVIKDYAWVSYNVCILKGVTIGEGAIIGAGSVVTHNVPDYCLVCGNPAKVIKKLNIE